MMAWLFWKGLMNQIEWSMVGPADCSAEKGRLLKERENLIHSVTINSMLRIKSGNLTEESDI